MRKKILILIALVMIFSSSVFAQKRPINAEDYYNLKRVSSPVLSPDGKRVAFVVTTNREKENDRISRIWMVDLDGGEPYPFTTPDRSSSNPRWSDDGEYLIFTSNRGTGNSTWHVNVKTGGEAFHKTDYKPVRGLSNSESVQLITKNVGMDPAEARDRKKPDFDGRIIEHRRYKANGRGFVQPRQDRGGISQIFTVAHPAGEDTTQLTFNDNQKRSPVWSYDDRYIVYTEAPDQRDEEGRPLEFLDRDWRNEVYSVSANGGSPAKLNIPEGSTRGIVFANNSNKFVYSLRSEQNGETHYYIYDLATGSSFQIGNDWIYGMRGMRWTDDDRWIYFSTGVG
ncbi:MAG: hypothetical protein GY863_03465, partial [bacterium]|nr:hypothetical protein [bacterium]